MNLFGSKLKIKGENWKKSAQEISYSVILGLLPMWMGVVLIVIFAPDYNWGQVVEYRQFILFSTALLATGFYCVGQEFRQVPFPGRSWFLLGLVILMVFATAMFSGIITTSMIDTSSTFTESGLLRTISIVLLLVSAVFVFFVSAINKAQVLAEIQEGDVLEYRTSEMEEFDKSFKGLGLEKLERELEKLEEEEENSNDK